jgi:hypothetical protein
LFSRFPVKRANATEPERTPNLAILATALSDRLSSNEVGGTLRPPRPVRPSAGADPLVQSVGCEVSSARPGDGACLFVDLNPAEPVRRHRFGKDRSAHPLKQRDLTGDAVGERQPHYTMTHDSDGRDIRGHTDHRNGSISRSLSPAHASRQFSSNSS